MTNRQECRGCGEAMQRGFVADHTRSGFEQARWCRGEPEPALFGGIKGSQVRRGVPVVVYRCPSCGRLEAFAPVEGD